MTAYIALLAKYVAAIDPSAMARTRLIIEAEPNELPHNYLDTAPARSEINEATAKLADDAIAIVGLGGTGSLV